MNSQYEINVEHSDALDAADRAFLLKTTVKELAARQGMVATFMGKPFNDQGGSGFHVHLSLAAATARNAFDDSGAPHGLGAMRAQLRRRAARARPGADGAARADRQRVQAPRPRQPRARRT